MVPKKSLNRYQAILNEIFLPRYKKGITEILFVRDDLSRAAAKLGIELPKNLGDVVYSVRYRTPLSKEILDTQPKGKVWSIEGRGKAKYAFCLVRNSKIEPSPIMKAVKIPNATPEVVEMYALSDEQALLAKVRYNRLIDIFLGITAYSLQNHLRTYVEKYGQVEIDEVYVGIDSDGRQYSVPVQAKGGNDLLGVVQIKQDFECCRMKFPGLICRAVCTQFMEEDRIAMFELEEDGESVGLVKEKHYKLVSAEEISEDDLKAYGRPN